MTDITRQEFTLRISAAIRTTIALYDEVTLFDTALTENLRYGSPPLMSIAGLVKPGKERGDSPGQKLLRRYVGNIFGPEGIAPDEEEAQDVIDEEAEDDENRQGDIVLQTSGPYLFVKIVIYESLSKENEPHLLFGRISKLGLGAGGHVQEGEFKVKRKRLKHLLAAIGPASAGIWVTSKARVEAEHLKNQGEDRRNRNRTKQTVAMLIDKIEVRPLYEYQTGADIARLADELRALAPR